MKIVYLDTNILLTLLRQSDPNFQLVEQLVRSKRLKFVTGSITIAEIFSILSSEVEIVRKALLKLESDLIVPQLMSLSTEEQFTLITRYLIEYTSCQVLDDLMPEPSKITGYAVKIHPIVKLAFLQSVKTQLRALDNLHFATARYYDEYLAHRISYLITLDEDFLKKRTNCQSISNIVVTDPLTVYELELPD